MENLTPPANGKNGPDGAPPAQPVPRWNVASWNRCARISASASSGPAPEQGNRPPPPTICTGTHPAQQIAPPAQTEGQSSSAPRAAALAFFFCPSSSPAACPACRISSPARAGRCAAPGKSWKVPGERWAQYPDITPTACTGKDQHRQRRTDDPAAHQLHRLPIAHRQQPAAPDLTAASSPPPAPTDTAPRQPCRPPAAADHPANSQKPLTAARRRRGQILYLTGIWPLQYSQ